MSKIKKISSFSARDNSLHIDFVGLYPNIPYDEGLAFLKDLLDSRIEKQFRTDTLTELSDLVLTNNTVEFSDKTYKFMEQQLAKFAPPYAILFMAAFEEKILRNVKKKSIVWWRYIDDIFFYLGAW